MEYIFRLIGVGLILFVAGVIVKVLPYFLGFVYIIIGLFALYFIGLWLIRIVVRILISFQ
jgi:hypothetical protein